jgi:RND family efflux transporter MFP subunit
MSFWRKLLRAMLPLGVIGVGVVIMVTFVKSRPQPKKEPRKELGALVEVVRVQATQEKLRVIAHGTVVAAEQVVLSPEVSGRVVWQHPDFVPGGRFKKGETLLRIDPRDYQLFIQQQSANVQRAQAELNLEASRKEIAKREWEILGEETRATDLGRAVALREPQRQAAEAQLESARSAKAQAQLAVSKTAIRSPFNAFVKIEQVDLGQLVSPAMQLGTLVGTDRFWVQVSIPIDKLGFIDVPAVNVKDGEGSAAVTSQEIAGRRVERPGRVVRLLGDLDPVGRMARVLVEIYDPLGLERGSPRKNGGGDAAAPKPELPILLGAFVEVHIDARDVSDVIEIPRLALHAGDQVYVHGPDGRLEIREVEIVWRREQSVLVKKGVNPNDEIIVSRLPNAVRGMRLRKLERAADTTRAAAGTP